VCRSSSACAGQTSNVRDLTKPPSASLIRSIAGAAASNSKQGHPAPSARRRAPPRAAQGAHSSPARARASLDRAGSASATSCVTCSGRQDRARDPQSTPTFSERFEHDRGGELVVDARGAGTRAVDRARFSDERRAALRARMEAANRNTWQQSATPRSAEVLQTAVLACAPVASASLLGR
jgi:hypothetical protein